MSITIEHLTKRYDGHAVVNDVSLAVAEGEFFVLLGPAALKVIDTFSNKGGQHTTSTRR